MKKLARFRADPALIRVAIRNAYPRWRATVCERKYPLCSWSAYDVDPVKAVDKALAKAARAEADGIDLDMQWAYDHPWP